MHVKYTGNEDYRVLASGDVMPSDQTPEGETWVYTWALAEGHTLEIPDEVGERVVAQVPLFRVAEDDEVAAYNELLRRREEAAKAAAYHESHAIGDQGIESSVPEESQGSTDTADQVDDQDDES